MTTSRTPDIATMGCASAPQKCESEDRQGVLRARQQKVKFSLGVLGALLAACCCLKGALAQPVQPLPAVTAPVGELLASAPDIVIANGVLTARVARIDAARGFYNGTRFDQAGVITSLKRDGREFYGPWFEKTGPEVLDYTYVGDGIVAGPDSAISGPVEEFAPLDFEAKPGLFIKPGVGVLYQPDTQPYDHYRHYRILDAGERTTKVTKTGVAFTQTLNAIGYGYIYEKSLGLVPGKPQLLMTHRLRNIGQKSINTNVYNHNFLKLIHGNGGTKITFPFALSAANPPAADLMRIQGNSLTYLRPMANKERMSFSLTGFGKTAADYDFTIEGGGASVSVKGDQPITRLNIFSIDRIQSVEPYIAIDLAPGAEKRWSYTYTFNQK
ncbi:MAG TPA: hypothetical protein VJ753_05935 [Rhizomicrobium sp.]|nr:hypothetical protein [Rhizomicrobium sp.]